MKNTLDIGNIPWKRFNHSYFLRTSEPIYILFHYHFAIAAEAVNPDAFASNADAACATINLDAWTLIAISESLNWVFWNSAIALPNCENRQIL